MRRTRGGGRGGTVRGEFYAGYRAGETPRRAVVDGRPVGIASVLSRRRVLDASSGEVRDLFRCRLADGRVVEVSAADDPAPGAADSGAAGEMDGGRPKV